MKSNKNVRKDDLSLESNTKKIYKMYKRKKQWVVAPVVFGLLINALSPVAALAVTDTDIILKAEQARAVSTNDLEALKAEAETNILVLVSLTKEAKDQFIKAVKDATNDSGIKIALKEARQADVVQSVANEKEEYASKINALSFLSDGTKTTYINKITALGFDALIKTYEKVVVDKNYATAKASFDTQLEEIKVAANEIMEQAIAEDTALANIPQYKIEQKAVINNLTYLSELQKYNYNKGIDAVETKVEIDAIVAKATAENTTLLSEEITGKIAELKAKVAEIKEVDSTKHDELIAMINGVGKETNAETLSKLISLESVIAKEVKDVLEGALATQLKTEKTALKTTILNDKKANELITDAEVRKFTTRVEASKTLEELSVVQSEWKALVAVKDIEKEQDIGKAQQVANDLVNKLELDEVQKNHYLESIRLENDTTEIAKIVVEAQNAAREWKEKNEAELKAAKEQAIKEINALKHLSKDAKITLIENVDKAINIVEVAEQLASAKTEDATVQLNNEKETAKSKIKKFNYLSEEEQKPFIDSIDKAESSAAITAILNDAIYADYKAGVGAIDNADLADAKGLAKEVINKLENLTAAEKTVAFKDIDKATTVQQITDALDQAKELDKDNTSANELAKELEQYKEDKKAEIDTLEFLSKEEKNGYKAEINLATDRDEVDDVFNKASAANKQIEQDKFELDKEKNTLINKIKNYKELTDAEKKQFISQTFDCKSVDEVTTLSKKIAQLCLDREISNAADNYKTVIKKAIDGLISLSQRQKEAYQKEVEATKDKAAAVKIYESAKAEDIRIFDKEKTNDVDSLIASGSYVEAQKVINQLKSDATRKQYQKKLNDSIALTDAKADANKQIDALENLSVEEKAAAKEKISKLTTKAAVEKEVKALVKADNLVHDKLLIELAEAQIKGKDFAKAAKTIEQIRDADTKAALQKQLENAQKVVPTFRGSAHVSNKGWMKPVGANKVIGTTGKSLQMEAVKLTLSDVEMPKSAKSVAGSIKYRAHVRNIGWQKFVSNGAVAGTVGQVRQMEAIQIKLTGELAKRYDVQYRVHGRNYGWQKYVSNGATAGTVGKSLRMEALQVRLVEKK